MESAELPVPWGPNGPAHWGHSLFLVPALVGVPSLGWLLALGHCQAHTGTTLCHIAA